MCLSRIPQCCSFLVSFVPVQWNSFAMDPFKIFFNFLIVFMYEYVCTRECRCPERLEGCQAPWRKGQAVVSSLTWDGN